MMTVRQNGKARTVTNCGVVVCVFDDNGVANVSDEYAPMLEKLGYIVDKPFSKEANGDDTGRETKTKTTRSKNSRHTDVD